MEIRYCEKCSNRVSDEDIESGHAAVVDGLLYCCECRSGSTTSSARRQAVRMQRTRRVTARARPAREPSAQLILPILGVVAVVAAAGLVWFVRRGGGSTGRADRPRRTVERSVEPLLVETAVEPPVVAGPAEPRAEPRAPAVVEARPPGLPMATAAAAPDKDADRDYFAQLRADLEEKRKRGEIPVDPSFAAPDEEPPRPGELAVGFGDGLSGWRKADDDAINSPSYWKLRDGTLEETSNTRGKGKRFGPCYLYTARKFTRFRASVRLYSGDDDVVGLRFGYLGPDDFFQVRLWREERRRILEERTAGAWRSLAEISGKAYPRDTWFKLQLDVSDDGAKVYVNGTLVLTCTAGVEPRAGYFGLFVSGNRLTRFRDVRVEPLEE